MRYLLCLCLCVFICSTHGPTNGDPAPGRSPGPPRAAPPTTSATTATTTTTTTITAATAAATSPLQETSHPYATADVVPLMPVSDTWRRRSRRSSWEIGHDTTAADRKKPREVSDKRRQKNLTPALDNNETTGPEGEAEDVGHPSATRAKPAGRGEEEAAAAAAAASSKCDGASLYVDPTTTTINHVHASVSGGHPVRLEVTHGLFDTRRGLTNQIIYKVQLLMMPGAISDFYVETQIDGGPTGQFVDADVADVASFIRRRNASAVHQAIRASEVHAVIKKVDAAAFDEAESWREMVELLYPKSNGNSASPSNEDNEVFRQAGRDEHASMQSPDEDDDDDEDPGGGRGGGAESLCAFCVCPNVWTETAVRGVQREMKWFVDLPTTLHNKTVKFRLLYRKVTSSAVFETVYMHQLLEDCHLSLLQPSASLDFTHMPLHNSYENCTVFFPSGHLSQSNPSSGRPESTTPAAGLLIHLTRLNVPCRSGGYVAFDPEAAANASRRLCGKLEDLTESQRLINLPLRRTSAIRLVRHPTFRLSYRLVDYCHNVSFTGHNDSYFVRPAAALNCSFRVHLPYGNRIELNVATNWRRPTERKPPEETGANPMWPSDSDDIDDIDSEFLDLTVRQREEDDSEEETRCSGGLSIQLIDQKSLFRWFHCIDAVSRSRRFNVVSAGNTLDIRVWRTLGNIRPQPTATTADRPAASVYFEYVALPERKFESQCAFGWIAVQQLCVTAVESSMSWPDAEKECKKRGGNLAVVRSEREQRLIDVMLINSPGFKDNTAYWIGATDSLIEGEFRWTSGYPFSYSNWFPGFSEHNNYNKQPNDDGLSGQDCVEMRRYFHPPSALSAARKSYNGSRGLTYMWNDRDCAAKNFFLCERPMSDALNAKFNWTNGCNKTVLLTRDRPKASLWSPNFPFEYPDNTNCFTVIKAPDGFIVVLEFEEFLLEKEPECTYDYLEIVDTNTDSRVSNSPTPGSKLTDLYRKFLQQQRHKRSASSENIATRRSPTEFLDSVYQQFLQIYLSIRSVVLRIPLSNADTDEFMAAKALPHRVCGDWNSKLKLLRFTSSGSLLGLHFNSDYSHHASGYKAKVSIKNITSECTNDRLVPYNGTCYLFTSYPEVDWTTAQSVCRGIGAELASVSSADEQRFIVEHIRSQMDYTTQSVYWVGGKLSDGAEFQWADGRNMTFRGWLPGEEAAVVDTPSGVSICLGLKWKMSPTPMLPSGIYWTAESCKKYGGYVCKSKKQNTRESYVENRTITGVEGRLTSPGYPNSYPLNADYWVKLIGPTQTRLIIQFQTIDLEPQDECLYDYVSVQEVENMQYSSSTAKRPFAAFASSDHHFGEASSSIPNGDYSKQDIHAKQWFHNDVDRIKRLKRDLQRFTSHKRMPQQLFLNREIKFLETFRKTLATSTYRAGRRKRNTPPDVISSPISPTAATNRNEPTFQPYVRWCGTHQTNMTRFDFVASDNLALLHFHSDYSQSFQGFSISWSAVDVSGCPRQQMTASDGVLVSPNYPNFLLHHLDCSFEISTGTGRRVWLEFTDFEVLRDSLVEVDLGAGVFIPFRSGKQLNDGVFVSAENRILVRLRTGAVPRGRGFRATYRTMAFVQEEHSISLPSESYGTMFHLNYPQPLPSHVNFTQHLTAPMGFVIFLEIFGVGFSDRKCLGNSSLEIYDNYADKNGTMWRLCQLPITPDPSSSSLTAASQLRQFVSADRDDLTVGRSVHRQGSLQPGPGMTGTASPVHITSFLNTLHVRQVTVDGRTAVRLNASVRIIADFHYKYKLVSSSDEVESCTPNPCQFGGKCITEDTGNRCHCTGHYTGRFCGLGMCEVDPCVFGKCLLTNTGFKCKCQMGYVGRTCDRKQQPCVSNPCEGRGECFNRNGGFFCRCHAWWEGQRCEKRMSRIPYKPLSDRMLQEPFWLGLITVFVVLAFIGLVWCAKRHFPEKIEKLLTEEAERNRPPGMYPGHHHHHQSLREQLQFTNSATPSTVTTPGTSRTLFTRLGIRKPSIISINSPQPPSAGGATARTFSLDDLLRPPPRRSPSPRKKRNNSTPTKTNAAEKTQILQQLIAPSASGQGRDKIDLNELINISAKRPQDLLGNVEIQETNLSDNSETLANDSKLEKKVTFARLLNKVSAEMSSGSESTNKGLDLPDSLTHRRASSMPPSPCDIDLRSPQSRSSTQSSDSMSSSEAMLPQLSVQSNRLARPKVSSADSILTMFKSLANNSTGNKSMAVSPSSSITTSSTHDEHNGDDESSNSSLHTPVSSCSVPIVVEASVYFRQNAFEVPALDRLKTENHNQNPMPSFLQAPANGQHDLPNNINQCLSPIRELPTPMPSPALTPIMNRPHILFSRFYTAAERAAAEAAATAAAAVTGHSDDDEHMSIDSDNRAHISCRTDPNGLGPSGFPNRESQHRVRTTGCPVVVPSIQISHEDDQPDPNPNPPKNSIQSPCRPKQLIIPKLVVEQSSPVAERLSVIYLGSPPPQRQSVGETNFFTGTPQQRKLMKNIDKPTSLDLLCIPPTITITTNMSDSSDTDLNLALPNDSSRHLLKVPTTGMCYLSPFSMSSRHDRTISESNLSSSGYSSMASPGPSRCGSNNPLFPHEMDDPGSSIHNHMSTLRISGPSSTGSRISSTAKGAQQGGPSGSSHMKQRSRLRSDSETLSDEILFESNDEGIETDHLDDRIEELAVMEVSTELNIPRDLLSHTLDPSRLKLDLVTPMHQLQLPTISVQVSETDSASKAVSPVSSRSESPLSDRNNGLKRFSSLFYGSKEMQMPFTDSDGLYDFPSSDGKLGSLDPMHSRKTSLRRRERKLSRSGHRTPTGTSPTKQTDQAPAVASSHSLSVSTVMPRRSPKRRSAVRHPELSSSSSESIALVSGGAELSLQGRVKKKVFTNHLVYDASTSVPDYVNTMLSDGEIHIANPVDALPKSKSGVVQLNRPNRRISRLRAFGNQLRFLRRFDQTKNPRPEPSSPPTATANASAAPPPRPQSSDSYQYEEDNTSNDEADVEISIVTSPLLYGHHNHNNCRDHRTHRDHPHSPSNTGESSLLVRRGNESPAKSRIFHLKQQQRKTASGSRKPWRSRNRRFACDGSVNSD